MTARTRKTVPPRARQPLRAQPKKAIKLQSPPAAVSRERLLEAAGHFFLQGSYHGVGVAEICSVANVRKGTFYHFFPSKTNLLLEVIERRVLEIEGMINKISSGNVPAARKIMRLFTMTQNAANDSPTHTIPPGFFLGNIILELASSNPPVQSAAKAAFKRWNKAIAPVITQLIDAEDLHNLDPEDAADALLGLMQGGAVMASAYGEPRKMRAFGHIALSLLRSSGRAD